MTKVTPALFFILLWPFWTVAQSTDDNKRFEFFAGFSHNRVDTGVDDRAVEFRDLVNDRIGFNGFNVSATGNLSRYVGLKFDFSGHYNSQRIRGVVIPPCRNQIPPCLLPDLPVDFELRSSLYNFLGGVQFKDNSQNARLKPFAHLLVGAAHARFDVGDPVCVQAVGFPCIANLEASETGFAGAFGGGLDIRLNDHLDFRTVQVDYNPTRIRSETQHNFRIGVGVVFR